jgi:hypothetical protein
MTGIKSEVTGFLYLVTIKMVRCRQNNGTIPEIKLIMRKKECICEEKKNNWEAWNHL